MEKAQIGTGKAMSDIGNKTAYSNADENADVEVIKANFEHIESEKIAYAKVHVKNELSEKRK